MKLTDTLLQPHPLRYAPIMPDYPHLLHGGDYNPDQWLDRPDIIEADFKLAREAGVNTFSIGIFAWAALEPEEGRFEFGWLDKTMDHMALAGMKAVVATPSGAKPNWMAMKYPEIRRVDPQGHREKQGGRHNHCFTSPVYREKVTLINSKLAERYAHHPALGLWHLSNEYSGECHCDLCKHAFRAWLEKKYGTLDRLNQAWWTAFWAHTYTDWNQINEIDHCVHGLVLDWKRFISDQTADFMCHERIPLARFTPHIPVTTNLMGVCPGVDYRRLAPHLDVISWDCYPQYHGHSDMPMAASYNSFLHDLNRCLKHGKPFLMMESSPSATNWLPVNKLLKPGIHQLKSLQAIAHGSDSVQYFQWRKSRGSAEKFHGAVVDHAGHGNTRVFKEVAAVGATLKTLDGVVGCSTPAEVALIYDWDSRWILEESAGPLKPHGSFYEDGTVGHYRAFWQKGVPVDVIGSEDDFSGYKLLIAPMLYLLKPGVADRMKAFVQSGGTLVGTFLTGIADENDLVFEGGWPGPLRPLFGIWAEEIDYLYDDESNQLIPDPDSGLSGNYRLIRACDLIHAETARVAATYGQDFYAGRPCLTQNTYGSGSAWYLATSPEQRFLDDFYELRIKELGLRRILPDSLPAGVTAQLRTDGTTEYVFLLNFTGEPQQVSLDARPYTCAVTGAPVTAYCHLEPYGSEVLVRTGAEGLANNLFTCSGNHNTFNPEAAAKDLKR